MPRRLRPYAPGGIFHLTARTQHRTHWFEPALRDHIVMTLDDVQLRTDATLLAFVVMSNHIHVLFKQGLAPIAAFMQPLLRRIALRVQRVTGLDGHVFERPFRDSRCDDPRHTRNTIYYIHRNPVKAGLCTSAAEYKWSSHAHYAGLPPGGNPRVIPALQLFSAAPNRSWCELQKDYTRYERWRDEVEAARSLDDDPPAPPWLPETIPYWLELTADSQRLVRSKELRDAGSCKPDLRDLVHSLLRSIAPDLEVSDIRGNRRREICRIRGQLITRAAQAGYRGVEIARFLGVCESAVSRIIARIPGRPSLRYDR